METKTLFISTYNNVNKNTDTNSIEMPYITHTILEPTITIIDERTNYVNEPIKSNIEVNNDKSIIEPSNTIIDNNSDERIENYQNYNKKKMKEIKKL